MISALYIETAIRDTAISRRIQQRFAGVPHISISRYGEVFNRKAQNFRLQKQRPALILAEKYNPDVLPTPPGYHIGAKNNYYVSHMLNCVYDCRYCFLQGMYHSANYVLFVNYADFKQSMLQKLQQHNEPTCFFSGYDCDSLALEPISAYVEDLLPFFAQHEQAVLELRTKSTQIRTLLKHQVLANVVVAFSFTPEEIGQVLEHKVPSFQRRIEAMQKLAQQGWPIGLRLDPLIYDVNYRQLYQFMLRQIFAVIKVRQLHSIAFGPFRLPTGFFRKAQALYPDEALFAGGFERRNGMMSYSADREQELRDFMRMELLRYVPQELIFPCEY